MIRILAIYPIAIGLILIASPVIAPRSGALALLDILSVHLALAAIVLAPFVFIRSASALRWSLLGLAFVSALRFGGEWVSLSPAGDPSDHLFSTASWNLEFGARSGEGVVQGLHDLDVDVVALQELGPEHAQAIAASTDVTTRFPGQALYPDPGVLGIGLLSHYPIVSATHAMDPATLEAVVDIDGQHVTVITAHPLPGTIERVGPFPVGFDAAERDAALQRIRARVSDVIGRGETVIVLGDFNVAPTEAGYRDLTTGLVDAHAAVGQGPGWTWRPSSLEWTGLGLLRIDHALSGPGAMPVSVREYCGLPGDHCQLEAWYHLGP